MHELAIAGAITSIASRHADGRPVRTVHVKVGYLRQVVPSSLQFAFELVSSGTALDGARLELEEVPARGRCRACGTTTEMRTFPLQCSSCGGLNLDVQAGEELLVDSLELDDDVTTERDGNGCASEVCRR